MITIATEDGQTYAVETDANIEIENLKALLEADCGVPPESQDLFYNARPLDDPKRTLASFGVANDDLILLKDRRRLSQSVAHDSDSIALSERQAAETLRSQLLSNPEMMAQLRSNRPELAAAVSESSERFFTLLQQERQRAQEAHSARIRAEQELANADEFDVEAQRKIEEAIRQEQVMENLEHAMEYSPESFGRVTMLYVDTKVNGIEVKAFVDSGAQATIMSPECAQRCGIMRLLDTRFAGIARGVGTAKILGRVHSAQIQLGEDLYLPCSFTIMEGRGVEMLFGLDMLKRYQASIDLAKNSLIIQGKSIRFLDEHELPASAKMEGEEEEEGNVGPQPPSIAGPGAARVAPNAAPSTSKPPSALGGLNSASSSRQAVSPLTQRAAQTGGGGDQAPPSSGIHDRIRGTKWPESSVRSLVDLGASETQAKALLDAAGGNVEVAASLLFQQ